MADSLFDFELPDDGDRVSLIGAPAEEPASSRASGSRANLRVRRLVRRWRYVCVRARLMRSSARSTC